MNTSLLTIIIIFGVGVGVGVGLGIWIGVRLWKNKTEANPYNAERREMKEKNKKKILELFSKQSQVSNNDVEKLIGVSDTAAGNYLQELESEGQIEQVGIEGRGVVYRLR